MIIAGLDLATRLTGWCVGDPDAHLPKASAWRWPQAGEDYGLLAALLRADLTRLIADHRPDYLVYEAPILIVKGRKGAKTHTDKLSTLRPLYILGGIVELVCRDLKVECEEATVREIKVELTGNPHAEKEDMVAAAVKVGLELPAALADGRYDAADAFGAWKVGVRCRAGHVALARWDQRVFRARGALL